MMFQRFRNDSNGREVEAVKLTGDNAEELKQMTDGYVVEEIDPFDSSKTNVGLNFATPMGMKRCSEGDYVIYAAGYFFTRQADDFEHIWQMT